jgi:ubiquinone/menaquinone biosynthesis C-methylase UbiE
MNPNALRIDGLTPQSLGSTKSWWDGLFTRLLQDAVPLDAKQLVEIDCGLAAAAHSLLPGLPDARYLGVDTNPARLAEAKQQLAEAPRIAVRAEVRIAPPTNVPLDDGAADVVLSIMSLQHMADIPEVMGEALRLLRDGGRLVVVEPDNLGQRFYFDGVLEGINHVMHALCLKARVARQPSDIAIGPRLPEIMRAASFHGIHMVAHVVHSSRMETAKDFFTRLHRVARTVASEAGLDEEDEAVEAVVAAANRTLFADLPKRLGYSSHTVPVFLCRGTKR